MRETAAGIKSVIPLAEGLPSPALFTLLAFFHLAFPVGRSRLT